MASNWGKGASNNIIGWGQGAINNIISWGKSHFNSDSGDTDISGLPYKVIIEFEARALADGGTFEAKQCLIDNLQDLL